MADLVTDLIADITAKIQTISAIKNKIIYMFDQDDLISEQRKIGLPAVGVVYNSMSGSSDSAQTGLAVTVIIDVYILGGKQCVEKISRATGVKTSTTQFLEDIRDAIKLTKPQFSGSTRTSTHRKWKFVLEAPVTLEDGSISYVQRWSTVAVLTE